MVLKGHLHINKFQSAATPVSICRLKTINDVRDEPAVPVQLSGNQLITKVLIYSTLTSLDHLAFPCVCVQ